MGELSKGDRVKVRTATGEDRLLRVAGIGEGVIYVTTEDEFSRAAGANQEPTAYIGFPSEDVRQV